MSNVKQFGHKIHIQVNNASFVKDQNNIPTKIVNAYIVYDLDNWSKIPFWIFILSNCLFGATDIAKTSNKSKEVFNCNESIWWTGVTNIAKNGIKSKWVYSCNGKHLMETLSGILLMTLLVML